MKLSESRIKEIIAEEMISLEKEKYFDHTDKEGRMAKRQLENLSEYASELSGMLDDSTQLESWVQSKITIAHDYISKIKHYLEDELGMSSGSCAPAPEPIEQPMAVASKQQIYEINDEDADLMET